MDYTTMTKDQVITKLNKQELAYEILKYGDFEIKCRIDLSDDEMTALVLQACAVINNSDNPQMARLPINQTAVLNILYLWTFTDASKVLEIDGDNTITNEIIRLSSILKIIERLSEIHPSFARSFDIMRESLMYSLRLEDSLMVAGYQKQNVDVLMDTLNELFQTTLKNITEFNPEYAENFLNNLNQTILNEQ